MADSKAIANVILDKVKKGDGRVMIQVDREKILEAITKKVTRDDGEILQTRPDWITLNQDWKNLIMRFY